MSDNCNTCGAFVPAVQRLGHDCVTYLKMRERDLGMIFDNCSRREKELREAIFEALALCSNNVDHGEIETALRAVVGPTPRPSVSDPLNELTAEAEKLGMYGAAGETCPVGGATPPGSTGRDATSAGCPTRDEGPSESKSGVTVGETTSTNRQVAGSTPACGPLGRGDGTVSADETSTIPNFNPMRERTPDGQPDEDASSKGVPKDEGESSRRPEGPSDQREPRGGTRESDPPLPHRAEAQRPSEALPERKCVLCPKPTRTAISSFCSEECFNAYQHVEPRPKEAKVSKDWHFIDGAKMVRPYPEDEHRPEPARKTERIVAAAKELHDAMLRSDGTTRAIEYNQQWARLHNAFTLDDGETARAETTLVPDCQEAISVAADAQWNAAIEKCMTIANEFGDEEMEKSEKVETEEAESRHLDRAAAARVLRVRFRRLLETPSQTGGTP